MLRSGGDRPNIKETSHSPIAATDTTSTSNDQPTTRVNFVCHLLERRGKPPLGAMWTILCLRRLFVRSDSRSARLETVTSRATILKFLLNRIIHIVIIPCHYYALVVLADSNRLVEESSDNGSFTAGWLGGCLLIHVPIIRACSFLKYQTYSSSITPCLTFDSFDS